MKYKVKVTVELEYETKIPLDEPQFFFEEHFCVDNLLEVILDDLEEARKEQTCLCYRSKVVYVGEAKTA